MIISQYPRSERTLAIDSKINELAKDRADRITKDALDDLRRVRDLMRHARRLHRDMMLENPDFETFYKKQIDELTQIIDRVGKQVGDLVVED